MVTYLSRKSVNNLRWRKGFFKCDKVKDFEMDNLRLFKWVKCNHKGLYKKQAVELEVVEGVVTEARSWVMREDVRKGS